MNAIMFTRGPAFKQCDGKDPFPGITSIHQLDIYPLLNNLLGIKPEKYNGNVQKIKYLMKNPDSTEDISSDESKIKPEIALFFVSLIILYIY